MTPQAAPGGGTRRTVAGSESSWRQSLGRSPQSATAWRECRGGTEGALPEGRGALVEVVRHRGRRSKGDLAEAHGFTVEDDRVLSLARPHYPRREALCPRAGMGTADRDAFQVECAPHLERERRQRRAKELQGSRIPITVASAPNGLRRSAPWSRGRTRVANVVRLRSGPVPASHAR